MIYTIQTRDDFAKVQRKLSRLDATILAKELARLAVYCRPAENAVLWLISTPAENMLRFRSRLENMATADYAALHWNKEGSILEDLETLLRELQTGASSDHEKMDGLIQICQTDKICFELGNDECTELTAFYCEDLSLAFSDCAEHITNYFDLIHILNYLLSTDNYGVRESTLAPALKILNKRST
ncbi:TPA: hypothetical protein ACWV6B_004421 [Salmonella enterica subsp. enterica serovar Muenchen]